MINLRKLRPTQDTSKAAAVKFIFDARKEDWPEDTLYSLFGIRFGNTLRAELLSEIPVVSK